MGNNPEARMPVIFAAHGAPVLVAAGAARSGQALGRGSGSRGRGD